MMERKESPVAVQEPKRVAARGRDSPVEAGESVKLIDITTVTSNVEVYMTLPNLRR